MDNSISSLEGLVILKYQQVMLDQYFWAGKRVFLSGHTGFKGSWLALWLEMLGAEVTGYALEPLTPRDNFLLSKIGARIRHEIGDVRDYEKLKRVFDEARPEIVFHLAAQPLVRESYRSPKETYDVNVGGTVNILECSRLSSTVKAVVNVTTDKCYENNEWVWGYRENDRLGGVDPYSSSKACSELVTDAYRKSFFSPEEYSKHGISLASARAGNVFGGGDWQVDRIIPDCIRHLEEGKPIIVRNPHSIRPWQHVLEPLSGYLLLAEKLYKEPLAYSSAWNFGPEDSSFLKVGELVDEVVKSWGNGKWEDHSEPGAVHEAHLLKLDITKAKALLGWFPVWHIEDAVDQTLKWYRHYRTSNVSELCCQQISDYMKCV